MTKVPNIDGTVDALSFTCRLLTFQSKKHDFTFQALCRKKFRFEQLIRNIFQSYYSRQQTLTQFYYNNSNITKNLKKKSRITSLSYGLYYF